MGIAEVVRKFYGELPFNYYTNAEQAAESLRSCDLARIYPDLGAFLAGRGPLQAIEFGCGSGWMCNTLALHHEVEILGIDFCDRAIERSEVVAQLLGNSSASFSCIDLNEHSGQPVDLVLSIGVLHHTEDAARSFQNIQRFVGPKGRIYLGLYHEHGRRPFLEAFHGILKEKGEAAAFKRFQDLECHKGADPTHLKSWFRDQVLHPHETLHSLKEVLGWLDKAGLQLESTSLNRFAAIESVEAILEAELDLREVGRRAIEEENRFYPGFFTVCASRP